VVKSYKGIPSRQHLLECLHASFGCQYAISGGMHNADLNQLMGASKLDPDFCSKGLSTSSVG
jgi:hypothetical protein